MRCTVLHEMCIADSGWASLKFVKLDVNTKGQITGGATWHQSELSPLGDLDTQINRINENLVEMGEGAIAEVDVVRIKDGIEAARVQKGNSMTLWDRLIQWLAKDAPKPQPVRRRASTMVAKKKKKGK